MGIEGLVAILGVCYVVGVLIPHGGATLRERATDDALVSLLIGMATFPVWGLVAAAVWLVVI